MSGILDGSLKAIFNHIIDCWVNRRCFARSYRRFDPAKVSVLALIRHCRSLGMSLDDIAALQQAARESSEDCRPVDQLLNRYIDAVRTRIQALQDLAVQWLHLRAACDDRGYAVRDCGILRELTLAACSGAPSRGR